MVAEYRTRFDVTFDIEHCCDNPEDIPDDLLLRALQERVYYLHAHPQDMQHAFSFIDETKI